MYGDQRVRGRRWALCILQWGIFIIMIHQSPSYVDDRASILQISIDNVISRVVCKSVGSC